MAEALLLSFEGVGQGEYEAVNRELGIDMKTGKGDWPAGLLMHAAGKSDDGAFIVTEVWASREAQGAFMESRLGEALGKGGITAVPTITWIPLLAHHTLPG